MTVDEAEALAREASGEATGRNLGSAHAGAEADTAYNGQPKSEKDWLMSQVVDRTNMQLAYSRVMKNRGAPGIDGMRCEDLKAWLQTHWVRVKKGGAGGNLGSADVAKQAPADGHTLLSKPDGGSRPLGIPTVADRIAQTVVKQHLEPRLEEHFHEDSYGYRPGKSARQALDRARRRCWDYAWVDAAASSGRI